MAVVATDVPESWRVALAALAADTKAFEKIDGIDLFGGQGHMVDAMLE